MSQYSNYKIEKTCNPSTNDGALVISNTESGKVYWTFTCDSFEALSEVELEVNNLYKVSSCPNCLSHRIGVTLVLPDELRKHVTIKDGA